MFTTGSYHFTSSRSVTSYFFPDSLTTSKFILHFQTHKYILMKLNFFALTNVQRLACFKYFFLTFKAPHWRFKLNFGYAVALNFTQHHFREANSVVTFSVKAKKGKDICSYQLVRSAIIQCFSNSPFSIYIRFKLAFLTSIFIHSVPILKSDHLIKNSQYHVIN